MSSLEQAVAEKKAALESLSKENDLLKLRANVLEKVVTCRDEQLALIAALERRCHGGTGPSAAAPAGASGVAPRAEDVDRCAALTKETLIPRYKAFLAEVSGLLLHCQHPCSNPADPIVHKTTACVERMKCLLRHCMVLNSPLMRTLLTLNLETGQPAAAPEALWEEVLASAQLDRGQRADVMAVHDMYLGLVAKVYEERRAISAALGDGAGLLPPGAATLLPRGTALAQDLELTERLAANLSREHSARALLCCFLLGRVLAPAQFAKVAVYAYPFFPDSLALASAIRRLEAAAGEGGPRRAQP